MKIATPKPGLASRPATCQKPGQHVPEPEDRFLSEHNSETLKMGLGASVIGSLLLGVPAALGAAAGGWGVAASALGYGALASQAEDTSEYPESNTGGVLRSAAFGGCVAAVGLAAGMTGAASCAALGACVGGLFLVAAWE